MASTTGTAAKKNVVQLKTITAKPVPAKPTPVKATPAKPAAAKSVAAKSRPSKRAARQSISAEQRRHYVEVAAYYIAERRGFDGGDVLADWMAAEAEIERLLAEGRLNA